jgi:hypothetical protein
MKLANEAGAIEINSTRGESLGKATLPDREFARAKSYAEKMKPAVAIGARLLLSASHRASRALVAVTCARSRSAVR